MNKFIVLAVLVLPSLTLGARAQDMGGETLPSLIEKLQACRGIDNAIERLVCFDNIVAALPAPETVAPTPVAETTIRQGEESDQFLDITEMWQDNQGMWNFRLRNGEVWRQNQYESGFPFEFGRQYYLQKGMFNSHYLRTPGLNRRVRVVQEH